jgi:hypothetical protein
MKTKLFALTFILGILGIGFSQESMKGHSHEKAQGHGGSVVMTKNYHFEVAFKPDAIAVYLYDGSQNALPLKNVTGEVSLKFKNGDTRTLKLKAAEAYQMGDKQKQQHHHEEMGQDYLQADVDLSGVEPGNLKATFSLAGLPNKEELKASFTETFNGFVQEKPGPKHEHK